MKSNERTTTKALSVAERIELVCDLWDSIAYDTASITLTKAQKQELDRRLALFHADPTRGDDWGTVVSRIRS